MSSHSKLHTLCCSWNLWHSLFLARFAWKIGSRRTHFQSISEQWRRRWYTWAAGGWVWIALHILPPPERKSNHLTPASSHGLAILLGNSVNSIAVSGFLQGNTVRSSLALFLALFWGSLLFSLFFLPLMSGYTDDMSVIAEEMRVSSLQFVSYFLFQFIDFHIFVKYWEIMYLIISSKELICRIYKRPTQLYSKKKKEKRKKCWVRNGQSMQIDIFPKRMYI